MHFIHYIFEIYLFVSYVFLYYNTVITYKKCTLMKPTEENLNIILSITRLETCVPRYLNFLMFILIRNACNVCLMYVIRI